MDEDDEWSTSTEAEPIDGDAVNNLYTYLPLHRIVSDDDRGGSEGRSRTDSGPSSSSTSSDVNSRGKRNNYELLSAERRIHALIQELDERQLNEGDPVMTTSRVSARSSAALGSEKSHHSGSSDGLSSLSTEDSSVAVSHRHRNTGLSSLRLLTDPDHNAATEAKQVLCMSGLITCLLGSPIYSSNSFISHLISQYYALH